MEPNKPQDTTELPKEENISASSGSTPPPSVPTATSTGPAFSSVTKTEMETPVIPVVTPVSQPVNTQTPPSATNKKPFGLMLGILVVLLLLFLGILFFFIFNKSEEEKVPVQQVPVQEISPVPTSSISPTPALTEEGVDSINIGSPEASLSPLQTEIQQL
jgi:hypothetical protein